MVTDCREAGSCQACRDLERRWADETIRLLRERGASYTEVAAALNSAGYSIDREAVAKRWQRMQDGQSFCEVSRAG
jgi:hypothetical protein